MSSLLLRGIGKSYGGLPALEGIDLDVPARSRTVIVGPSGSGKTTLLRLIAGFEAPDSGQLLLDDQVLADEATFVPAYRRGIGIVVQDGALFPHMSIADNIGFGMERSASQHTQRILELMEMVELPHHMASLRPHQLSGGQQQRVALARALARQPKLMLLDEPFSALDAGLRESMRRIVTELMRAKGITTILVTHDQAEAMSFADRLAVLRDGRLIQAGSPRELYFSPTDRETAIFLGDAIVLPATLGEGYADCVLGRIPTDTLGNTGNAEIMLRPEQISLGRVPASLPPGCLPSEGPCLAEVKSVEFAGASCAVTIAIGASPISLRIASIDAPSAGAHVSVTVRGKAHVFREV